MLCKIRKMDQTGDSVLAECDTEKPETVQVAQDELTRFLEECIRENRGCPPVFARRIGAAPDEFAPFPIDRKTGRFTDECDLTQQAELLVQFPLAGG